MFISLLISMSASMLSPILMVYLQDYFTTDLMWLALTFIPSIIVPILLGSRLGVFADRFGYVRMMIIGLSINAIVVFIIHSAMYLISLSILWCIDSTGDIIEETSRLAFISEISEESTKGEILGFCSASGSVGAIIGPLLGGILYDNVSAVAPFYANGTILIIASILIFYFFKSKKE